MKVLKIFSSIFIPPVGVYLETGISRSFWLNIPLTLLGIIPGIIHAVWCLSKEKNSLLLDIWGART